MNLNQFQVKASGLYEIANDKSRGTLEILRQALLRFGRVQGLEASAAIAYYAIFSIFPLLLTLISVVGFVLAGDQAVDLVLNFIGDVVPVPPIALESVLRQVVTQRDVSGIVGIAGLLLAGSGVFTTLARNINRAWPNARRQSLVRAQLIAFGLIAVVATTLILWMIWTSFIGLLLAQDFLVMERLLPFHEYVLNPLAGLFPFLAAFLLFLIIYRWLPNTQVRWREAFWGALFSSIAWAVLTVGFSWYVRSGLINYDLLYGSLGTSIALLTWVFISAIIILFGAHLSASIARTRRPEQLSSRSSVAD
jgi:membrane protein